METKEINDCSSPAQRIEDGLNDPKIDQSLCDSCGNMQCVFQSGIKRESCSLYIPKDVTRMDEIHPVRPFFPVFPQTEKEKRDFELYNAISTAVRQCGLSGEDVTMMTLETLKQLGRYDLLPPCER